MTYAIGLGDMSLQCDEHRHYSAYSIFLPQIVAQAPDLWQKIAQEKMHNYSCLSLLKRKSIFGTSLGKEKREFVHVE